MIWESTVLMTLIDAAIISVTLASLWILYRYRIKLIRSKVIFGSSIVVVGLSAIGLFYCADLFTMYVLPSLITRSAAMAVMEDLHLNYSWIVIFVGTFSIFTGLSVINQRLFSVIDSLERTEASLNRELSTSQDMEKALRQSEERFRALYDENPSMFFTVDAQGMILSLNEFGAKQLGYRVPELLGHSVLTVIYEEDRRAVLEHITACVEHPAQVAHWEFRKVRKNGSVLWAQEAGRAFEGPDGRLVVLIVCEDITERKRAEEALRESEARYAKAEQIGNFGNWDRNFVDNRAIWSKQTYHIFGVDPDQFEPSYDRFLTLVHPSDRELLQSAVDAAMSHGERLDIEYRIIRPDGKERVIHSVGEVHSDENGQPLRLVGTVHDITDRKQAEDRLRISEERYRTLYTRTPALLQSIDKDYRLVDASDHWLDVFGYQRSEVIGRKVTDFMTVESRRYAETVAIPRFLATGDARDISYQFVKKNGEIVDILVSAIAERDAGGNFVRSLAVMTDVTERKRAEQAVRESEERFRALVEGTFEGIAISEQGKIIQANQAFADMFGYELSEVIGLSPFDATTPESAEVVMKNIQSGFEKPYEIVGVRKDGTTFNLEVIGKNCLYNGRNARVTAMRDITERKRTEQLRATQTQVLDLMTRGRPLADVLTALVRSIEQAIDGVRCTVLLLDAQSQCLRLGVGPSFPEGYLQVIDGLHVGPDSAPCALAAHHNEEQLVEDMATDPRCAAFSKTTNRFGLRSCRSIPIRGENNQVIGVFTVYPTNQRWPGEVEMQWIRSAGHLAGIAIERKQAEEALRESEARFRRLAESNIIGIIEADIHGSITEANDVFLKMLGYTKGDLPLRWDKMTPPEWRHLDDRAIKEIQRRGMATPWEKEFIRKDGSRIPILVGVALLDKAKGNCICFVLDLTGQKWADAALRESELWLRAIFNSQDDAVFVVSPDRKLLNMNTAAQSMLGYSIEEVKNLSTEVVHVDHQHYVEFGDRIRQAFARDQVARFEFQLKRRNGEIFPTEHAISLLKNTLGEPIGIVSVVRDITERKRADAALQAAHKEMEGFIYTVSHDMKSPIITLQGFISALRQDYGATLDKTALEYLGHIQAGADKLARIVNDLLHLSRAGRTLGPLEVTNSSDLIHRAIKDLAPSLEGRGVKCEITGGPLSITCDPYRIGVVLRNLVDNALRYMGDQPTPRIEVGSEEHDGEYHFFVRDNGMGIDPRYHGKIFELFETLGKGGGTGVGLALVKKIVETHGGQIWVESAVGQGSTFYFTLPKQPAGGGS